MGDVFQKALLALLRLLKPPRHVVHGASQLFKLAKPERRHNLDEIARADTLSTTAKTRKRTRDAARRRHKRHKHDQGKDRRYAQNEKRGGIHPLADMRGRAIDDHVSQVVCAGRRVVASSEIRFAIACRKLDRVALNRPVLLEIPRKIGGEGRDVLANLLVARVHHLHRIRQYQKTRIAAQLRGGNSRPLQEGLRAIA